MANRTVLYDQHVVAGAKMVDFAGWDMPLHYGSQIEEHHRVRREAGMFDVSHMAVVDLHGPRTRAFLAYLLANDPSRLILPGKALYSCMLNEQGGVLDDLIIYFLREDWFRVVVNAAMRQSDLAWIRQVAEQFAVTVEERADLSMVAVQGPGARERTLAVLRADLASQAAVLDAFQGLLPQSDWFVARTGYTGEDGFEVMLPHREAADFWQALVAVGVSPCGLGSRDTLRLEAGMNLYGSDMDESTTPLESGLTWTVIFSPGRDFIGRAALEAQYEAGISRKLVGLVLEDRGVMRHGQELRIPDGDLGIVTSGGFSPTLNRSIALARVPASTTDRCEVAVRGRWLPARVVKPPFVRFGKPRLTL